MIFENPVRVSWGTADFAFLADILGSRRASVVTTPGMAKRGTLADLQNAIGDRYITATYCQPNPSVASIQANAAEIADLSVTSEVLIALGGGSAIDTAKGIAAAVSPGCSTGWLSGHLRSGGAFPKDFSPVPIIAIPTTAGTGSEVTMWGTVWDEVSGAKHSISHPKLFVEHAVLVPELTLSVPRDVTLFTALDALSHCMESMWNKRASAVSDAFASAGIAAILRNLDGALSNGADLQSRKGLQEGALLAGLAISCTATALAHSISYPLTSQMGMPHGLACSFTLPELMRFNTEAAPERITMIASAMGAASPADAAATLDRLYDGWKVRKYVADYLEPVTAKKMHGRLLTPGRADNNVRPAGEDEALEIVLRSLQRS